MRVGHQPVDQHDRHHAGEEGADLGGQMEDFGAEHEQEAAHQAELRVLHGALVALPARDLGRAMSSSPAKGTASK